MILVFLKLLDDDDFNTFARDYLDQIELARENAEMILKSLFERYEEDKSKSAAFALEILKLLDEKAKNLEKIKSKIDLLGIFKK